jgi:hypothetical protein
MFNCRICTDSPLLSALFGTQKASTQPETSSRASTRAPSVQRKRRDPEAFAARDLEATQALVQSWESFVHPRAREFFPTPELLLTVLTQIAKSVNTGEDPILGDSSTCVHWYGEVTKDEPAQAAIRMIKPGETAESVTFVNRVLVFIFATDDSFSELMKLPKEPFKMICGDQLCCSLHHISTTQ